MEIEYLEKIYFEMRAIVRALINMKNFDVNSVIGRKFGCLTVLKFSKFRDYESFDYKNLYFRKGRAFYYECQCDCGNIIIRDLSYIRSNLKTCEACMKIGKHGLSKNPIMGIWTAIKQRCFNPNCVGYKSYGGRGIFPCKFILESPANLLKIVGERPSKYYSLDRLDNNKGYTCGQCEECKANRWKLNMGWKTLKEQSANKRTDPQVEILGVIKYATEWTLEYKEMLETHLSIV